VAKRKPLDNLSAQELYELAQQREQEEMEEARESLKGEMEQLRARRKDLMAQQKKELAALDKEINALKRQLRPGRQARNGGNVSQAVIDVIGQAGRINTKDLKSALDGQGVETSNLGQTLAYLKRKGRIVSPARAVYALA
jgi:chromosome segregation ATPase